MAYPEDNKMASKEECIQLEIPCPDKAPQPCDGAVDGARTHRSIVIIDGEDEGDDDSAVHFDI